MFGTSRNVASVPNPSSQFPLLDLDITSQASISGFLLALTTHPNFTGQVDALINNAG